MLAADKKKIKIGEKVENLKKGDISVLLQHLA